MVTPDLVIIRSWREYQFLTNWTNSFQEGCKKEAVVFLNILLRLYFSLYRPSSSSAFGFDETLLIGIDIFDNI